MAVETEPEVTDADSGQKDPPQEIKVPRTRTNAALLTQLEQRRAYRHANANGPSHSGSATFRTQRLTALALAPLAVWLVIGLVSALTGPPETAHTWLGQPVNAALMAAFVVIGLRHAAIGIQVVLEDYVHSVPVLTACKLALYAVAALSGLAAVTGLVVILFQAAGGA